MTRRLLIIAVGIAIVSGLLAETTNSQPADYQLPASGLTVLNTDGTPNAQLQGYADGFLVPMAPGTVTVHDTRCYFEAGPGVACTTTPGDDIWMQEPPGVRRRVFAHELGHRYDYQTMTNPARALFQRHIHDTRLWDGNGIRQIDSPHEQFAEAYSLCARHRRIRQRYQGWYGYTIGPIGHQRICTLIRNTSTRR